MLATVLVTTLASMLAFSLPATAAGGTAIAGAPAVTPGVQQFGNTAAGSVISCYRSQFWTLNVVAGDQVVIDWEAATVWPSLAVFPVGTTDFSLGDTRPYDSFELNSNGKAQSTFTAPTTGAMPVRFRTYGCADSAHGPYDFTVYIKHATVVSFQQPAVLSRTGTLQVSVHNPDGAAITSGVEALVQARLGSEAWTTMGSAMLSGAPTTIGYALPASYAGRTAQVRVVAGGAGYLSAASATASISVQGSAGPGPGSGEGGGQVHVTLKASPKTVKRLHSVHLKGHATHAAGARVKIYQRQEGRSRWEVEGTTRVNRKGKFGYSEVIHQGSRYYRACVGSSCSRLVYVRFRA
jgi:hypothetical protein